MPTGREASIQFGTPTPFAAGNNAFAFAMYEHLRHASGNVVFSPFNLRAALGMVLAGAAGETAAEIRAALRLGASEALPSLTEAARGDAGLVVANSLWMQTGVGVRGEFLERVARDHDGAVFDADFRGSPERAGAAVDQWIDQRTHGRLGRAGGIGVDPFTRLVLVSAVYFEGQWTQPFPRLATHDGPFQLETGGTVQAPLMTKVAFVPYAEGPGYQAVELAYRETDLSMLLLLPRRPDGLRDLTLSSALFESCIQRMRHVDVLLVVPRFAFTWGRDLRSSLAALGIRRAFDPERADFSSIDGRRQPDRDALFLSGVSHRAWIEVDEERTEAAAVTAGRLELMCAQRDPRIVFRADHPFLFAIRDGKNGAIVFLGRVAAPAAR